MNLIVYGLTVLFFISSFFCHAQQSTSLPLSPLWTHDNNYSNFSSNESSSPKDSILTFIKKVATNKGVDSAVDEYTKIIWTSINEGDSSALYHAIQSLEMSKLYGYAKGQAKSLEYKGLYYEIVEGNIEKALQLYFRAAQICEIGQLPYLSEIYHTIGVLFHTTDNYKKAKDYYEFALRHARQDDNRRLEKKTLINLGSLYSSMKEFELAESFFLKSLDILGLSQYDFDCYANLGNMYLRQNNYVKALPFLEKATEEHPDNVDIDINLRFLIDAKAKLSDTTNMGAILRRAKISLGTMVNLRNKALLFHSLANYYRVTGAFERALFYYDDYLNAYGEFLENQKNELVFELEAKYQNEKAQTTIARQNLQLEKEMSKRKRYLTIGVFGTILLLSGSVFLYMLWKGKVSLKAEIIMKESALNENKLLLAEIHHRTKNNLQLLDSLLSLQSRATNSPEVKQVLQSNRDSVGTINLLHHQLYRSENFKKLPFQLYINDLCTYFKSAFGLEQRNIKLTHRCSSFDLDTDKAISLGLIINELVTNAIKHAFKNQEAFGEIYIKVTKEDKTVIVEVEDTGTRQAQRKNSNLGTGKQLIKIFTQRYKADFEYQYSANGTTAIFKLPI